MCHANIAQFRFLWCAKTFLLYLTCFNSTVNRIGASEFLLDIGYFNYSTFLVHGHYSAFLLLDIYSQWPLLYISVTQPFLALSKFFTQRFSVTNTATGGSFLYHICLLATSQSLTNHSVLCYFGHCDLSGCELLSVQVNYFVRGFIMVMYFVLYFCLLMF